MAGVNETNEAPPNETDEVPPNQPNEVPLRDESIRLGQLLKLANVVQDGSMARMVIENGEVTVDGQLITRRGVQVRPGSVVTYGEHTIRVTRDG